PELHKIGRLGIERESFKDQAHASDVELAHVLLKPPGRNGGARDGGIVPRICYSPIRAIHAAFGKPELKPDANLQLKLVLELRIESPVITEPNALAEIHGIVLIRSYRRSRFRRR